MAKEVKKLYFAYGSNMSQSRLEVRVGKVDKIGVIRLPMYRLAFTAGDQEFGRFANLMKTGDHKDFAEGVVYALSNKQMRILDRCEGSPEAYNRVIEKIRIKGKIVSIIVYIAINLSYIHKDTSVPVNPEYIQHLITGCNENGLTVTREYIRTIFRL